MRTSRTGTDANEAVAAKKVSELVAIKDILPYVTFATATCLEEKYTLYLIEVLLGGLNKRRCSIGMFRRSASQRFLMRRESR